MELSEIHDCEKCQGKIVGITIDNLGITRCAYCNQIVNYKPYFMQELKKYDIEFYNKIKDKNF
mgnify:CR=1 FL=1